jgi:RHS repeat-associated protein
VTLSYDADGNRVRKQTAAEQTTYMLDLYERREHADGTREHVVYVDNGRRVFLQLTARTDGVSSEGEQAYLHGDVVGSPEVVTGMNGLLSARRSYGAFGAERDPGDWLSTSSSGGAVRVGFSGHEEDREHGYVNMTGRLYDPVIARFVSPDPLVASPSSQDLNRYSYGARGQCDHGGRASLRRGPAKVEETPQAD